MPTPAPPRFRFFPQLARTWTVVAPTVLTAVLGSPGVVAAQVAGAPPPPPRKAGASTEGKGPAAIQVGPHRFEIRTLKNGLRALAIRDAAPRLSVFMVIAAGKRHETPATTGLAHLTEHAMYTGTATTGLGQHDRKIHGMGGESNAFTREDYTLFYDHNVPTSALADVLAMEADRLRGLTMKPAAVRFERERLRREEARTWTEKDARRERIEAEAFRRHNYRAGVLDAQGHTAAPTLGVEAVRKFYDTYYHPDQTAVVVVGDVAPGAALDAIDAAFGSLPKGPPRPAIPAEPDPDGPRTVTRRGNLAHPRSHLVWLTPPLDHPDRPALALLAKVLGGQRLADGKPVDASSGDRVDRDLFQLAATGEDAAAGLEALVAAARAGKFDAREVARSRKVLAETYASLPLRARPYFSLAGTVGVYAALNHLDVLQEFQARVAGLTPADLQAAARTHLRPDRQLTFTFQASGKPIRPLPTDPRALQKAAEAAEAAGNLDRAITAYTRLLDAQPSKMFRVIYLTSRGQIYAKQKDYDGAIKDYEDALRVIDYPGIHPLLKEARQRRAAQRAEAGGGEPGGGKAGKPTSRKSGRAP